MPWIDDAAMAQAVRHVHQGSMGSGPFSVADVLHAVEDLALALATATSVPAIVAEVAEAAGRMPGEPVASIGVSVPADGVLRLVQLDGFGDDTLDRWGVMDLDASLPLTDVMRDGRLLHIESREEMLTLYPHLEEEIRRSNRQRWAIVPLVSPTGNAGVVGLGWADSRPLSEIEQLYLTTISKLGGEALRRAARETERRDLVTRLADASDNERAEIARDLHDNSIQRLAALLMRVGMLHEQLGSPGQEALATGLVAIERDLQVVIESLRDMVADLHPPDVVGLSLHEALGDFATWLFADTATALSVAATGEAVDLDVAAVRTAHAVGREALLNARRHAGASTVEIEVNNDRGGWFEVVVRDDGVGLSPEAHSGIGHLGIRTMHERVELMAGSLTIGGDRNGTTVRARFPVESGQSPA